MTVARNLRKWYPFPRPTITQPAPPARARIPARKFLQSLLVGIRSISTASQPAAAAVLEAALTERDNLHTGRGPVSFLKETINENPES
jgi:hypothetical protein